MKKKLASIGLTIAMILNSTAIFAYYDIDDHWANKDINNMKNMDILRQFTGNYIEPNKPMTRKECAILISDFLEVHEGYKPIFRQEYKKFADLGDSFPELKIRALSFPTWKSGMTSQIVWSKNGFEDSNWSDAKIINGIRGSDGNLYFNPSGNVTRAEFAKMLLSALDCFGYIRASNYGQIASDADLHWARKYLLNCNGFGILTGYNSIQGNPTFNTKVYRYDDSYETIDTVGYTYIEFRPDNQVTRAEAITMIARAKKLSYVGRKLSSRPEGFGNYLYYIGD